MLGTMTRALLFASLLALVGCSETHSSDDAGPITVMFDAGPGGTDAGPGATDAGPGVTDAGPGATDAGPGTMGDAGPGGMMGIDCMGMTCDPTTQQCCITTTGGGPGGGAMAQCIPNTEMCMGAAVECDGPEDCGGNVCCARASLAGVTVMCEPDPSTCGAGGFGEFELCNTPADCSTPMDMCCPINMFGITAMYCAPMCF